MASRMKNELIKLNMQRIIQLEPEIATLVGQLDLGVSKVYSPDETIKTAEQLSNILVQMDSDLTALVNLLED